MCVAAGQDGNGDDLIVRSSPLHLDGYIDPVPKTLVPASRVAVHASTSSEIHVIFTKRAHRRAAVPANRRSPHI